MKSVLKIMVITFNTINALITEEKTKDTAVQLEKKKVLCETIYHINDLN